MHHRYRETDPDTIGRLINVAFEEHYRCPYKRARAFKRWFDTITAKWGEEVDWADLCFTFWIGDTGRLGLTVTRSTPPLPML